MPLATARLLVALASAHIACGVLFVLVVAPRLLVRVDPGLRDASAGVRLLIAPGLAALWPLFAWRLLTKAAPPVERNAHRDRATPRPRALRPSRP